MFCLFDFLGACVCSSPRPPAPTGCHPCGNRADGPSSAPPRLTLLRSSRVLLDCSGAQLASNSTSFPGAPVITHNYPAPHCGREAGGVGTHMKDEQTEQQHKHTPPAEKTLKQFSSETIKSCSICTTVDSEAGTHTAGRWQSVFLHLSHVDTLRLQAEV